MLFNENNYAKKVELANAYLHCIFGTEKNDSSEFFKESL